MVFLYIATDINVQRNSYSADRNYKTVRTIGAAAWYLRITNYICEDTNPRVKPNLSQLVLHQI